MRNASAEPARSELICACCGRRIVTAVDGLFYSPPVGSPRRFCSPSCRVAAWRRRRARVDESTPPQRTGGRSRSLRRQETSKRDREPLLSHKEVIAATEDQRHNGTRRHRRPTRVRNQPDHVFAFGQNECSDSPEHAGYTYAGDDPIDGSDPSGQSIFGDVLTGLGLATAAVGVGLAIVGTGGLAAAVGVGVASAAFDTGAAAANGASGGTDRDSRYRRYGQRLHRRLSGRPRS